MEMSTRSLMDAESPVLCRLLPATPAGRVARATLGPRDWTERERERERERGGEEEGEERGSSSVRLSPTNIYCRRLLSAAASIISPNEDAHRHPRAYPEARYYMPLSRGGARAIFGRRDRHVGVLISRDLLPGLLGATGETHPWPS